MIMFFKHKMMQLRTLSFVTIDRKNSWDQTPSSQSRIVSLYDTISLSLFSCYIVFLNMQRPSRIASDHLKVRFIYNVYEEEAKILIKKVYCIIFLISQQVHQQAISSFSCS